MPGYLMTKGRRPHAGGEERARIYDRDMATANPGDQEDANGLQNSQDRCVTLHNVDRWPRQPVRDWDNVCRKTR